MAAKLKHNHELRPYNPSVMDCPRCAQLRAEKEAAGETQHNHDRQPFGRRVDGCPRCTELAAGATPREHGATRAARLDAEHAADIRAHFAPGHNERCPYMSLVNGHWTGVCVYGDW